MILGFMGIEVKPGQIWVKLAEKRFGDIASYCVISATETKRGVPMVELANCATMKRIWACSQDEVNSFTFDCELTERKPNPALFGGYKFEGVV
jgi:hypothetical protein